MQKELVIISDIHGCYYTMLNLLGLCPKGRPIIFNGDLVDRGLHSDQVVEYARAHDVPTVMGNHEGLMLYGLGITNPCGHTDAGLWEYNGGDVALKSYGGKVPTEHIDWIRKLPFYFEFDDLLVSHTGFGKVCEHDPREALWARRAPIKDGKFYVIGHTPAKTPMFFDHYAMIDTGAAYASRGFGHMTAFLWPEKNYITIPTDKRDIPKV